MRSAIASICFGLSACGVGLLLMLPSGSAATFAPLAVIVIFAPLSALLWPYGDNVTPASVQPTISIDRPVAVAKPETHRQPVKAARKSGGVAKFMAERLTRADGQRVKIDDLLHAYSSWCEAKGLDAMGADEFQQRVNDLCEAAGIRRGRGGSIINVALTK